VRPKQVIYCDNVVSRGERRRRIRGERRRRIRGDHLNEDDMGGACIAHETVDRRPLEIVNIVNMAKDCH